MTDLLGVFALDGHDGAGKTTLARALAERVSGVCVRPFHGTWGRALLEAGAAGDLDRLVAVGTGAMIEAIQSSNEQRPLILDRGWMTVASLCPLEQSALFSARWHLWVPSALCWADLPTTLTRSAVRHEKAESVESHRHYLDVYKRLAEQTASLLVRTDQLSVPECLDTLREWMRRPVVHEGLVSPRAAADS